MGITQFTDVGFAFPLANGEQPATRRRALYWEYGK